MWTSVDSAALLVAANRYLPSIVAVVMFTCLPLKLNGFCRQCCANTRRVCDPRFAVIKLAAYLQYWGDSLCNARDICTLPQGATNYWALFGHRK